MGLSREEARDIKRDVERAIGNIVLPRKEQGDITKNEAYDIIDDVLDVVS